MGQTIQTATKLFLAIVMGILAFKAFQIIIGSLIFMIKAFFFIGLCAIAYLILSLMMNKKSIN